MEDRRAPGFERIRIEGYKSIRRCDLALRATNVMIGANGAGKSNLISALTLMQYVFEQRYEAFPGAEEGEALFHRAPQPSAEILMEALMGEAAGFVLAHGPQGNAVLSRTWGEFPEHGVRVYHFYEVGREARAHMADASAQERPLDADASNLAPFLHWLSQSYPRAYQAIVDIVRVVAPYFGDFVLEPAERNGRTVPLKWRQRDQEEDFFSPQLSDGTLRFIRLAALLLQPEELRPALVVIDEPELGLHPFAITLLAEMIKQSAMLGQVLVSTQSAELLNHFAPEDLVVVDRQDEASTFTRPDPALLREWMDEGYTLGDLWKKNVFGGRVSE